MDERWEEIHSTRDWGKYPSIDVVTFIARNFYSKDREKCKILDYGCGQGANTWFLAREGFGTYAFDGSKSAVEKAKIMLDNLNLKADFKVMDGKKLDYEAELFDCVIDCGVVCANTTVEIKQMLSEIFRVLKSGGKTISTALFNSKCTGYGTGELIGENTYRNLTEGTIQGIGSIHFFEKDEIVKLWSEAGFTNISIDEEIITRDNGKVTTGSYIATAEKP